MDIGNFIFSYGQAYVALSRVTSLDGLHLINYDPSSVIASKEVIIEYNRLKQIHKPESEIITVSKERYHKVKDVPWTLSKIITSAQESDEKTRQSTGWILRGFQNIDKVSCYANAVLQCLLHLNIIRKHFFNYDKLDVLNLFAHRYEHGMNNLNTYEIRQFLGQYFSDAFEFLTALCTKYDYIKNLVQHQITSTSRCKSCGDTKIIINNNVLLSISVDNLNKKSYKLNDLLNTFSHWCQLCDKSCERCRKSDILFKNELTLTKEIIIIRLNIFSLQDNKLVKIPQKLNLSTIPTTKVLIAEQGHYTSMCREDRSWIEIHDAQIKKKQWPKDAKDIYILFLQTSFNKNVY